VLCRHGSWSQIQSSLVESSASEVVASLGSAYWQCQLGSPCWCCTPSQPGQAEAIIKPCFLKMLSVARSDYVIYFIRDEPRLGSFSLCCRQDLALESCLCLARAGMFWGPKHRRYEICVICLPVWVLLGRVDLGVARHRDSIWYLSLIDGSDLFTRKTLSQLWTSCPKVICVPKERITDICICRHGINTL